MCQLALAGTPGSSPRSWGCFSATSAISLPSAVFPTLVGVFPTDARHPAASSGLPHARGGVSVTAARTGSGIASSPRSWGCFFPFAQLFPPAGVFPTLVGVFPGRSRRPSVWCGLPHARGGVSQYYAGCDSERGSSPRSWGCFWSGGCFLTLSQVFPTLVGVFPGWRSGHCCG